LEGPAGIIKGRYELLTSETISYYKNRGKTKKLKAQNFIFIILLLTIYKLNEGGFDMIRAGRDKIEKPEEFESSYQFCTNMKLDGLVVIGGDDSNTNACLLADYF
jgi:6-phosphofructokinase